MTNEQDEQFKDLNAYNKGKTSTVWNFKVTKESYMVLYKRTNHLIGRL